MTCVDPCVQSHESYRSRSHEIMQTASRKLNHLMEAAGGRGGGLHAIGEDQVHIQACSGRCHPPGRAEWSSGHILCRMLRQSIEAALGACTLTHLPMCQVVYGVGSCYNELSMILEIKIRSMSHGRMSFLH